MTTQSDTIQVNDRKTFARWIAAALRRAGLPDDSKTVEQYVQSYVPQQPGKDFDWANVQEIAAETIRRAALPVRDERTFAKWLEQAYKDAGISYRPVDIRVAVGKVLPENLAGRLDFDWEVAQAQAQANIDQTLADIGEAVFSKDELRRWVADTLRKSGQNPSRQQVDVYIDQFEPGILGKSFDKQLAKMVQAQVAEDLRGAALPSHAQVFNQAVNEAKLRGVVPLEEGLNPQYEAMLQNEFGRVERAFAQATAQAKDSGATPPFFPDFARQQTQTIPSATEFGTQRAKEPAMALAAIQAEMRLRGLIPQNPTPEQLRQINEGAKSILATFDSLVAAGNLAPGEFGLFTAMAVTEFTQNPGAYAPFTKEADVRQAILGRLEAEGISKPATDSREYRNYVQDVAKEAADDFLTHLGASGQATPALLDSFLGNRYGDIATSVEFQEGLDLARKARQGLLVTEQDKFRFFTFTQQPRLKKILTIEGKVPTIEEALDTGVPETPVAQPPKETAWISEAERIAKLPPEQQVLGRTGRVRIAQPAAPPAETFTPEFQAQIEREDPGFVDFVGEQTAQLRAEYAAQEKERQAPLTPLQQESATQAYKRAQQPQGGAAPNLGVVAGIMGAIKGQPEDFETFLKKKIPTLKTEFEPRRRQKAKREFVGAGPTIFTGGR